MTKKMNHRVCKMRRICCKTEPLLRFPEICLSVPLINCLSTYILIRSNKMQQYAGIYLLQNHSTCFGCPSHPSSGVHNTVNFILIRSNKMQQYAGIYLLQNHSTCFGYPSHPSSGVRKTVTAASGTGHVGGRLLLRYYDLYQRLQLQFYVLLMTGVMDTRNI